MNKISIEIFCAKSTSKALLTIDNVDLNDSILAVKRKIASKSISKIFIINLFVENVGVERLSLRLEPRGKSLRDEELISKLNLPQQNSQLYIRDLGPQIAWKTVIFFELHFYYF